MCASEDRPVVSHDAATSGTTQSVASEKPLLGSLYEKHVTIYVRSVRGWWTSWRWVFVWLTQLLFYGLPWIEWHGRQAILFHLVERKFYLFGLILWPQDVIYLTALLIISAYALFLFTAVAGRLFCGYACPQTVYTEIFLWIEKIVEGERAARMKLDKEAMNARKLRIKTFKHGLWLLVALWTGFTFVGYFTPIHELIASVPAFGFGGWEIFWIFFYAGFTYLMAGFMREQVCKYMCPYARFQSVMFDRDTMIIAYDTERGEPRGLRKKGADYSRLGDCVDCGICVQVCPVGIDIRKGLQYECIGCGACIDCCDEVMDKLSLPRGLVSYNSENAMDKKYPRGDLWGHIKRPRILVYSAILGIIMAVTAWSLATRVPLRVDILRDRSIMSREANDGRIENIYILKIMNMRDTAQAFILDVGGMDNIEIVNDRRLTVSAEKNEEFIVKVRVPYSVKDKGSHKIYFDVMTESDSSVAVREKSIFLLQ
jgi:cytochrome c oxidase accessory protein FixG